MHSSLAMSDRSRRAGTSDLKASSMQQTGVSKFKAKTDLHGCGGIPLSLNVRHVSKHLCSVGEPSVPALSSSPTLPPPPQPWQWRSTVWGRELCHGIRRPTHWLWLCQTSHMNFSLGLHIFKIRECGLMISTGPSSSISICTSVKYPSEHLSEAKGHICWTGPAMES